MAFNLENENWISKGVETESYHHKMQTRFFFERLQTSQVNQMGDRKILIKKMLKYCSFFKLKTLYSLEMKWNTKVNWIYWTFFFSTFRVTISSNLIILSNQVRWNYTYDRSKFLNYGSRVKTMHKLISLQRNKRTTFTGAINSSHWTHESHLIHLLTTTWFCIYLLLPSRSFYLHSIHGYVILVRLSKLKSLGKYVRSLFWQIATMEQCWQHFNFAMSLGINLTC